MVDEFKLRADIGYVGWCWEVVDGIKVFFVWLYVVWGDFKFREFYGVGFEYKFVWVEYYFVVFVEVELIDGLEKVFVEVICLKEGVVDVFSFVSEVGDNFVESF